MDLVFLQCVHGDTICNSGGSVAAAAVVAAAAAGVVVVVGAGGVVVAAAAGGGIKAFVECFCRVFHRKKTELG